MMKVLADGEWHTFEELIKRAAPTVGPQTAQQWYRVQLGNRHKNVEPWRVKAQDVHDQIRDGRRDGLRRTIARLAYEGLIEVRNPSGRPAIAGKEARLVKK